MAEKLAFSKYQVFGQLNRENSWRKSWPAFPDLKNHSPQQRLVVVKECDVDLADLVNIFFDIVLDDDIEF